MTYQDIRRQIEALEHRLAAIAQECRKVNHAGCNPGTHELANRLLALATNEQRKFE